MKIKPGRILCATDFSEYSKNVLRFGKALAGKFDATLLVFHSVCFPRSQYHGTILERSPDKERLIDKANVKVGEIMSEYAGRWKPIIAYGDPVEEAARAAEENKADLVVAASHEQSGLRRLLMGTVVERMARVIAKPLLVVQPGKKGSVVPPELDMSRIVAACSVPVDASPVIGYALGFAEAFGSELHLFHAIESPMNEDLADSVGSSYGEMQEAMLKRMGDRILAFVPENAAEGIDLRTALRTGHPGEGLCAWAVENRAGLIVVGVRRRGPFEKIFVGSTTEAVLRRAPCPVLIIPEMTAEQRKGGD